MTSAEELAKFLATGPRPGEIADFRFSERASRRLEDLIRKEKNGEASKEEREEIDVAFAVSHLLNLTKLEVLEPPEKSAARTATGGAAVAESLTTSAAA